MRGARALAPIALIALACGLLLPAGAPADDGDSWQPLPELPSRPFLLVEAERRFRPSEPASLHIQLRGGGEVRVGLFRLRDPARSLGLFGARQGVSVAQEPLGEEAERLWARRAGPLPARGASLELLQARSVMTSAVPATRQVFDEQTVFDENDAEDSVATYWVRRERWSEAEVSFGPLPAGIYLARAHAGSWATSALLSIGEMVLLARRGDETDRISLTDADGRALAGVEIRAEAPDEATRVSLTDARGEARFAASDAQMRRFVARRGADLAFTDAQHARLDPCDPRVYLATGRPIYLRGERAHIRGHVRGCDEDGDFVPLAGVELSLRSPEQGEEPVRLRTDARGDFVAELEIGEGQLEASLGGRRYHRPIRLRSFAIPRRSVRLELDRAWARPGERVRATVRVDPPLAARRDLVLSTPSGRLHATIEGAEAAVFDFEARLEPGQHLEEQPIEVSLLDAGGASLASSSLIVSRRATLLELESPSTRGHRGEPIALDLSARDPLGRPSEGDVQLEVFGSDGNERVGPARARRRVGVGAGGRAELSLPLPGAGPWIVRASRGGAQTELVFWERDRPPQLSRRGPMAILTAVDRIAPGETLSIAFRAPREGGLWLTLEQGGVRASRRLRAGGRGQGTLNLPIPADARGMASLVLTHIAGGRVQTVSRTLEVTTSRPVDLQLETAGLEYAPGARARVRLRAHHPGGDPGQGVVSLWLADAGYWDLGEDPYPLPGPFFRLPGRMASGAQSTTPQGYGAEEGRVLPEAGMRWNDQPQARSTHRHGWLFAGSLVRFRARGGLLELATALARAAGLRGAEVCPERASEMGEASLEVQDLPWTRVAEELEARSGATPHLEGRLLVFSCNAEGMASGAGNGAGAGGGAGFGRGGGGGMPRRRLEGTLHFVGLRALGPDGMLELDLPLPAQPGRWRVEALVIGPDGGGARAHRVLRTTRPLEAWLDVPRRLRVEDEGEGTLEIVAPSHPNEVVAITVQVSGGVELRERPASQLRLDARGRAHVPLRLRGRVASEGTVRVEARLGAERAISERSLHIGAPATSQPLAIRAFLGPEAQEVHLALPELAEATSLRLEVGAPIAALAIEALERLSEPRWNLPLLRLDRLESLAALRDAAQTLPASDSERAALLRRLERAAESEAIAFAELVRAGGEVPLWRGLEGDASLAARAAIVHRRLGRGDEPFLRAIRRALRAGAEAGAALPDASALPAHEAALLARALAGSAARRDQQLARELLRLGPPPRGLAAWQAALEAARSLDDAAEIARLVEGLGDALQASLGSPRLTQSCAGPAPFLCLGRDGTRGQLARAALALLAEGDAHRALAVRAALELARRPAIESRWIWGSAAADEIALMAHLRAGAEAPRSASTLSAFADGVRVPIRGGEIAISPGVERLVLRIAASRGRFSQLGVRGTLPIAPPEAPRGDLEVRRRLLRRDEGWRLQLEGRLPPRTESAELSVPLPAGLTLAPSAEPPAGISMLLDEEGLLLRIERPLEHASPGRLRRRTTRFQIELPLLPLAPGRFSAGPPTLRAGASWAIGMATQIEIEAR